MEKDWLESGAAPDPGAGGRIRNELRAAVSNALDLVSARPQAHVVFYERVSTPEADERNAGLALGVETFTRQIEMLARRFELVPLRVLVEGLRKRQLPRRAVALVLGEGYRRSLRLAHPVLARHKAPATIFVTVGKVGTRQWTWSNELTRMALAHGLPRLAEVCGDRTLAGVLAVELPVALRLSIAGDHLLRVGPARRGEILECLRANCPVEPGEDDQLLSWDELRDLRAQGMDIGSQTLTGPVLPELDRAQVEREVASSRNVVADHLGHAPTHFCYPFGSYSPTVKEITGRYYGAAVSAIAGRNTPGTDPLEIRRIGAPDVDAIARELDS